MRCLLSLVVAAALAGQDSRFSVQSRLVLVPVNVTDAKGRTIDGLDTKDFVVLDEGRPQKAIVDTIATGVAPIALIVAIQSSGISKAALEKVHNIGAMIQPLVTGERGCAAVVSFSTRVVWLQECTNSDDALARAFEQVRPGAAKTARMLDAVQESIERLRQHPNSRRVLLLISESRDRGSETALDHVAVAAQTAGVIWQSFTFVLNGLVFVLIGLHLPSIRASIREYTFPRLLLDGAVFGALLILLRLVWVFPGAGIAYFLRTRLA